MKSTLIFVDTPENGKRGTLRGLTILPIYCLMTITWFYLTKKLYSNKVDKVSNFRKILSLFVTGVLIVSAIAVHTPDTRKKAIVYGALVGFVIYGITNAVLIATSNKWTYTISIIDTLWGIASTSLLSYILYEIVEKFPNILKVV
jgi:uncharacterized membrane protein